MRYGLAGPAFCLSVFFSPGCVSAASFDCSKAVSLVETTVCHDPALSAKDEVMAKLYKAAMTTTRQSQVLSAQRKWVAIQEACGDAACLSSAYDDRLGDLFDETPRSALQTFKAGDGHHILKTVEAANNWLVFNLSGTYIDGSRVNINDGQTSGAFRTDAPVVNYRYTTEGVEGSCVLAFSRRSDREWDVTAADLTSCGWGFNVTMDGRYLLQ